MEIETEGQSVTLDDIDLLFVASGVFAAGGILNLRFDDLGFDRPLLHRIVNLVFEEKLQTDLCYFYGFSSDSDFYRITNYPAFSGSENDTRCTVEVLGRESIPDEDLPERVVSQLIQAGVIEDGSIRYSDTIRMARGFPRPTRRTFEGVRKLNRRIEEAKPDWIEVAGAGAGGGDFFQNETLLRIEAMVRGL